MADRGLALLDGGTVVIVLEERGELRIGACRGEQTASLRIAPVQGSALGALKGPDAVACPLYGRQRIDGQGMGSGR